MRSDQLLRGMHKVLSHDLPNEMVVLRSLLQLLDAEESTQLSDAGREYVRRLQNATGRAGEMVRFLKEMGRLNHYVAKCESIPLTDFARELQGELPSRHPDRHLEFVWHWDAAAVVGDAHALLHGMLELFAGLLETPTKRCLVSGRSKRREAATVLEFHLHAGDETRPCKERLEQRMEIILGRAWLALCGAGFDWILSEDAFSCFAVVVPDRP